MNHPHFLIEELATRPGIHTIVSRALHPGGRSLALAVAGVVLLRHQPITWVSLDRSKHQAWRAFREWNASLPARCRLGEGVLQRLLTVEESDIDPATVTGSLYVSDRGDLSEQPWSARWRLGSRMPVILGVHGRLVDASPPLEFTRNSHTVTKVTCTGFGWAFSNRKWVSIERTKPAERPWRGYFSGGTLYQPRP